MSDRFVRGKGGPRRGEESGFGMEGANGATLGTGLGLSQGLGLLLEKGGKRPLGQALRGGLSELFHEVEVDVQARSRGPEGTAGNDFAPVGGKGADFLEQFGREGTPRHGKSCLELAEEAPE